jgi:glycosyltransferase involved in cell wall biosynthesis
MCLYLVAARRRPEPPGGLPRVVHVTPSWFSDEAHRGGGERYPIGLCEAMADEVPTTLITFGPQRESLQQGRLQVEVLRPSEFIAGNRYDPVAWSFLPRLLAADVVHCHQYRTATSSLSIAAGAAFGKRVFVTDHGGGGLHFNDVIPLHRLITGFLPVSRFSAEQWKSRLRTASVLHGGVDARFLEPHSEPRGREILFVGRLLPHKGVDVLVDALPPGVPLTLLGRPQRPEYTSLLEQLSAGKEVRFILDAGDDDLRAAYRRALVTVLPSVYVDRYGVSYEEPELLGLTLLESMACGTPVICTDAGAMPEIVEDGVTGFVVPPSDPIALRERLQFLSDHPEEAASMGQRARETVLREYTWKAVVARCLEAYSNAALEPSVVRSS